MKKTLLKMTAFFMWLSLPIFLCLPPSIANYQYQEELSSSDISLQPFANILETGHPPAFMEYVPLGTQTIAHSYNIRDTVLNVIKAEYRDMVSFVDLKTLAEQFAGSVNIESTVNIVPADPAAGSPAKVEAQALANAALIVDPVNQGKSPVRFLFEVEAAPPGLMVPSEKLPVPIAAAIKDDGLVKTEVSPQEQGPALILPPDGLSKVEHKITLAAAVPGKAGQVGITRNMLENQNPSVILEKEHTLQSIPDTPAGQVKPRQESRVSIIKSITNYILGAIRKTPAAASKSTNLAADFQKPKGGDEKKSLEIRAGTLSGRNSSLETVMADLLKPGAKDSPKTIPQKESGVTNLDVAKAIADLPESAPVRSLEGVVGTFSTPAGEEYEYVNFFSGLNVAISQTGVLYTGGKDKQNQKHEIASFGTTSKNGERFNYVILKSGSWIAIGDQQTLIIHANVAESPIRYCLASARHPLVSYTDAQGVRHENMILTPHVRKEFASSGITEIVVDFGMKRDASSTADLISQVKGCGEGRAEYNPVAQAAMEALKQIGSSVIKLLINELQHASPGLAEDIQYFLSREYYLQADPKIQKQILHTAIKELRNNRDQKIREHMPALLRSLYATISEDFPYKYKSSANKILKGLTEALQKDTSPQVRFQAGYELLSQIGNSKTLSIITKALCTDPAFNTIIDPPGKGTHARIANEFSTAFNVNLILPELIPYLGNENTSKLAIALLAAIGQPAVEPLLRFVGNQESDPARVKGAVAALSKIGATAVIMPLINIINNPDMAGSIKTRIMEKVTYNSDFDLSRTQAQWKQATLDTRETPLIRALAFSKIKTSVFLENYVFNTVNSDGSLSGLKPVTVEEFIGILASGVPAKQGWWDKIKDLETKTAYINKILAADMTDRRYHHSGIYNPAMPTACGNWVGLQFATQVAVNSSGWDNISWTAQESFINCGAGYHTFPAIEGGYGVPIYCAVGLGGFIRVFNAIFMGNDFDDQWQRLDYHNWLFIDPQDDMPIKISSYKKIEVFLTPANLFTPNGFFGPDAFFSHEKTRIKLPDGK
ncbi:hypothetical protein KAR10_00205, partial [bacterium]|nr:hypothetical protein [bacterium]